MLFQYVEKSNIGRQSSIKWNLFFMNTDISVDTSFRSYHSVLTMKSIKDNGLCWKDIFIEQFSLFFSIFKKFFIKLNILVLLFFLLLLICKCFCSNRRVQEKHLRKRILKHDGKVFDIALIDESLLRIQTLDPLLWYNYSLIRFLVNTRTENTFP